MASSLSTDGVSMYQVVSVEVLSGNKVVVRACLAPNGTPRMELVDGTEDDLRLVRTEAFGAENVIPLDSHAFFSGLLAEFPSDLASAFGAFVAIPSYG